MDDHPSQILIAAFADAEQLGLTAGRMFTRHKSQPGSEITSFAELSA